MEPKFPHIIVQMSGEDGNPVAIVSRVCKAMQRASIDKEDVDAFRTEALSGNYDHVLQTAFKTVTVN